VPGIADAVFKLMMRAESRAARLDSDGAIQALLKATSTVDTFIPAWRALAGAFEQVRKYPEANEAYRRILMLDPDDLPALNNLAYNLAVYEKQPKDALPLAARAARLGKRDPLIDDTLGWIHHLLGDDQQALRLLEPARRVLPTSATIQFHAALVFRAVGRLDDARKALDAAGQLDPSLRETTDFRVLDGDAETFPR
jgi:tetratricopeptide (TPR) repeat protein